MRIYLRRLFSTTIESTFPEGMRTFAIGVINQLKTGHG